MGLEPLGLVSQAAALETAHADRSAESLAGRLYQTERSYGRVACRSDPECDRY